MTEFYEFGVSGAIGPLIRSCVPELTPISESGSTVLSGTVRSSDELQSLLEVLDAHGLSPLDIRLHSRDAPAGS